MSCHSTRIELFYFDDNFRRIAQWVRPLRGGAYRGPLSQVGGGWRVVAGRIGAYTYVYGVMLPGGRGEKGRSPGTQTVRDLARMVTGVTPYNYCLLFQSGGSNRLLIANSLNSIYIK